MHSDQEEKLAETIIGEAVIELLDTGAAISWRTLLDRLHKMIKNITDEKHLRAALYAIDNISRELQITVAEKSDTAAGIESYSAEDNVH